ncbi:MAG: thioredoxin domain-containing protein [Gammaproteobacteria bacterium]|nr:MAG: thioredoxin domain-containing protein [Gammaproteobacteria bacterium]
MTDDTRYTNHLITETSPYLLQHAHNPVEWYPWGPQALEKARQENRPILLSIGYSACHWCHVMAHESFEDPGAAEVMNRLFINIKVDREERPDLDKIYQTAHSLLTQRTGGWPLTMFLTPDEQVPYFGGTYFPDQPRHGMPAFTDLCQRVSDFYIEQREELDKQNRSLIDFMSSMNRPEPVAHDSGELNAMPLDVARQQLEKQFDATHGGFGGAPKFPHPTSIERLLRHWAGTRKDGEADDQALHMALFSLDRMALGGMYDQIGGGFCRYSVDEQWMIPHFEKMLYDNGPLLSLYSEAWTATHNPLYRRIVEQTAEWVMREMQSPEGGYYSSLDADSEGEEGKYYVWTPDEVQRLLSEEEHPIVAARFGFDRDANFEGRWHAHVYTSIENLSKRFGLSGTVIESHIESARSKLFNAREQRIRPGRDDKVLVSWNALMIKGLAQAARHFNDRRYQDSTERALHFLQTQMWSGGRLHATYKDGHAHLAAYLDDYVFLIDAILELLQVRWNSDDLTFALKLAEVVMEHFADPAGGFYFTADDHENLIQRPKPLNDDALPAGNAIAAKVFARLGHLLGETRFLDASERTLKAAWNPIQQSPYGHTGLLLALEETLYPVETVIIRAGEQLDEWQNAMARSYTPRRLVFAIPDSTEDLPAPLQQRNPQQDGVAYVCQGMSCLPPVLSIQELEQLYST